jgi:hypothetical protein
MRRFTFITLVLGFASASAQATVLYKLVDPVGNVTFADAVPSGFRGEITRLDIDTSTMPPTRPTMDIAKETARLEADLTARRLAEVRRDDQVVMARARVDAARAALENAQNNSVAEDWIYVGPNNPLGMRRMPQPEYAARLERLESEVFAAQAALDNLEREAR